MEYNVVLKNPFAKADVVAQLSGAATAGLPGFGWNGGARPLAGPTGLQAALLSPAWLQQPQPLSLVLPAYENTTYALYLLSSRGGTDQDYYHLDSRTLVYDQRLRWAYWEPVVHTDPLDVTAEQLKEICPPASTANISKHLKYLNDTMRKYQITTRLRQVHFLSQLAHESGHFAKTLEGASGKAYEGRVRNLGNTQPGDGPRFKGRGLIQLTGRDAYTHYGKYIGRDLTTGDNMKLVEQEPYASDCAGWYWLKYKSYAHLNAKADKDDFIGVTRGVNGGLNGVEERRRFYQNAKRVFALLPT